MGLIRVGISDYHISKSPNSLVTLGLGSCVGIAIYDKWSKVGGLSHILLPSSLGFTAIDRYEKFADLALPKMIEEIENKSGTKYLVAKIAGGSSMFTSKDNGIERIGDRNVKAVMEILDSYNIPIIGSHTGGNLSRTMTVDLNTFDVLITVGNNQIAKI